MTILAGQRLTTQLLANNLRHTIPNGYAATTSNTTGVTNETIFLTSSTMVLQSGRAYQLTLSGLIMGTQPDTARLYVKRTSSTGTTLFDTQGVAFPRSGNNGRVTYTNAMSNTTGTDISTVLVATIQRWSGTAATVGAVASSTSPFYLMVEDIGLATDYPNATAIS